MSKGQRQNRLLKETAEQLCEFLPGIDRLIYIGGTGSYADWTACEWVKKSSGYGKNRLEITEEISKRLLDVRRQKPGRVWTEPDAIPFYVEHGKHTLDPQLTLQHEQKHLTLVVRLKTHGALTDLVYIFFRNDKSNFGISHDTSPIDTSQKSIIGMLTYNFANIVYQKIQENKRFTDDIKKEFVDLLKFHTADNGSGNENGRFEKWKIDWAEETLSELSERDGINYVYKDEALDLLIKNGYSFSVVKKALEDAARVSSMMYDGIEEECYIEKFFIKFTNVITESAGEQDIEEDALPSRIDKVYQFLDRLENAAQKLIVKDLNPTSERVGKEMDDQITAPAIRDFLKKNRSRVVLLLRKHPDKWKYIRRYFRPVLNIIPKGNRLLSSNAG